jgi:GMP synthase-like glutamine amidotransferase
MKVHVLQHVPFEGLGSIGTWLRERGAQIDRTRFWIDARLPPLEDLDLLVALGGPMSVNDEAEFPWLRAEKQLLREAIAGNLAVLGVCLGAQLIASALGARVYRNPAKEIGWFPIRGVAAGSGGIRFPPECTVFHWHGETFDLPGGAVRLAESAACDNQAFQVGHHVVGLQFHLETTPDTARSLVEHCRDELTAGPFVQTERQILDVPGSRFLEINGLMGSVLDWLVDEPAVARADRGGVSARRVP